MDARTLYAQKERDPADFPLFNQVWEVLNMAPSSKHADEEEIISLTWDAFDYLQASGHWFTQSVNGHTEMRLEGNRLLVKEHAGPDFTYEHTFHLGQTAKQNAPDLS